MGLVLYVSGWVCRVGKVFGWVILLVHPFSSPRECVFVDWFDFPSFLDFLLERQQSVAQPPTRGDRILTARGFVGLCATFNIFR